MQKESRFIRVFISSTFRDMFDEREELVKRVFPQLRKLCEERRVVWGEVDLRWGVTDEQKAEGQVLPLCLAEIKRCRPYFIGLLGERYGWVPDEIPPDLIEQEAWLKEHLHHSVTELEILHGVLRNPDMAEHAFFYFRDPAYIKSRPHDQQADFTSESPDQAEKLRLLKEKIRASDFPLRENYPDPRRLGELVLADFIALIDRLYPKDEIPDPLDQEAAEHNAFAQSRARVYIGRPDYFDRLDNHAAAGEPPLVVQGESGCGKSALLANWALRYREQHPDELLIMHFVGASPYSADWAAMLRRIMGELKRRFDLPGDIPDKPDELRLAFANWLHMAAAKGRVVILLDALNQLEDRDGAPDLVWLPPVIPDNVRIILSTLPGRPLDELNKRGWPALEVHPLTVAERSTLITEYLAQYTKALSPTLNECIAGADTTSNPLYLRALLEELRLFGKHEQLEKRIGHYLAAQTIPQLYERILVRWEADYERDRPGLVKDALTRIWAARRGITEAELMEMLGDGDEPLPRAHWSPLFLAAEHSLVTRSGLIGFFHDYLREAVKNKYLPEQADQHAAHLQLADYFEASELSPRKVDELPWQLSEAQSWQRLSKLLADPEFLFVAMNINQFDVRAYWARMETGSSLTMLGAYKSILEKPAALDPDHILEVAILLTDFGYLLEALSLHKHLAARCSEIGDTAKLSNCLGNQALILHRRGDLAAAMKLLQEEERLCRNLNNKLGLMRCLGNQALILRQHGDLKGAMALNKEEELLCRELANKDGLMRSLSHQALILRDFGDPDSAMKLHKEAEILCREINSKDGLLRSWGHQALILRQRGDLDDAMALHKEEERLCRELGDKHALAISLGNQALIVRIHGDLDGAIALHKEEERLCRELSSKDGLMSCLGNQALILRQRGDLEGAMTLFQEVIRLCKELGSKDGLMRSLGNQALILIDRGELEDAMSLLKEQERLCLELGNKDGLANCLTNQALILQNGGDIEGAMTLHKKVEHLSRELGSKHSLLRSLNNQATILQTRGDIENAIALYRESESLCRELGDQNNLAISLVNQALLVSNKIGQPREALPLAEEAYRIATHHGFTNLANQIKNILNHIRFKLP